MRTFPLKYGDTKTLTVTLSDRGAALAVTPTSVSMKIAGLGTRSLTMGSSGSVWTYKFVANEIAAGDYEAEVKITWADGAETAPTSGRLKIHVEPAL